jgi:hypothetical protein
MLPEILPIYLRVAPRDIAYLKFLFESYDEVAIVRTLDRRAAVIVLLVMGDFQETVRAILDDVRQHVAIEVIDCPPGSGDDWLMREI